MGANRAPLFVDPSPYSYESDFLDSLIRNGHMKLANLCYRCIKGVCRVSQKMALLLNFNESEDIR